MDGVFEKSRFSIIFNIIGIISGISLIVMFLYFTVAGEINGESLLLSIFFIFFGLIDIMLCLFSLFLNRGAYFHLDENGITSKFLIKTKLNCKYSEIAFCEYSYDNLIIRMNNGRRYFIPKMVNAFLICDEIRRRINAYSKKDDSPLEKRLTELKNIKEKRKKLLIITFILVSLLFLAIAVTVIITDGKEISDFNDNEKKLFIGYIAFSVVDVIFAFLFASKSGKFNSLVTEKTAFIKKSILKNALLPTGNLLKVYIDTDYTVRVIIFGYPNADEVYYITQAVDDRFNVVTNYSSKVFESIDELDLDDLIDISE